ncbi:MAG: PQQ-binding-like beta-propeller repeat protein [Kiritimatiellaeota bacterium]|nr:PQQ-binding-like beta-propeller repeat protein [Kiritimatiellota bacterium]
MHLFFSKPNRRLSRRRPNVRALFLQRSLVGVLAAGGLACFAGDWPMWRHDPLRSGATTEALPTRLQLEWVREFPAIAPAWPEEPRNQFDLAYEPVIAGKRLFIASPVDGSIRAWNADTGEPLWSFYTAGPARFAPAVWKDRVFAVSDDGFLYALDAATGRLLWKVNGSGQEPRRQLGNNRLVSRWAARGGPVVASDGTVYFAAGIWPTLGVYIRAVNGATGKPVWTNEAGYWIPGTRIDHNEIYSAGLSPQGYLLAVGDRLLVPNGRSMPAGLDRRTGKLLYYIQGYRRGHCRVTASERVAFVGRAAVVSVDTGREMGSKWKAAGKNAPQGFDVTKWDLFEGPFFSYKFMPGCNAWSVVTSTRVYGLDNGVFYGYDLTRPKLTEYTKTQGGREFKPLRWDLPRLWALHTPQAGKRPNSRALVLAGNRLYGNTGRTLLAVDLPKTKDDKPRLAWSMELESEPATLAAADGKLFIGTLDGKLLCLGNATGDARTAKRFPLRTVPLRAPPAAIANAAKEMITVSGATSGFVVLLGVRNTPELIAALLATPGQRVVAVLSKAPTVKALRDALVAAGVYGDRVEVFETEGDPTAFRLPPFLANLIVAELADSADLARRAQALFRSLRPYGGTMLLRTSRTAHAALATKVRPPAFEENARIERRGAWSVLRRPGKLPGAADWTHECADAARTYFSRDERVRPPLGILWYGDGDGYGFYKYRDYGAGVKPQVAGGRVIVLRQRSPATLCALDAYTGRQLWNRQVGRFTRYVSLPDAVYVADADRLIVLDAETGANRMEVKLDTGRPARDKPVARDIRVAENTVTVAVGFGDIAGGAYTLMQVGGLWDSKVLVALDRNTGKQLWRREAANRFNNNAFAVGDGRVFCTDSFSPVEGARLVRRGVALSTVESTILALDARTGAVQWQQKITSPYENFPTGNWLGQRSRDDWLGYSSNNRVLLAGRSSNIYGLDADTGKKLWERKGGSAQPVIIRAKTCITQAGLVLDIRTGRQQMQRSLPMRKHGCNYAVVGTRLEFVRDAFVSYTDIGKPTLDRYWLRNIRSGCDASLVAADGLLNVPNLAVGCVCNYPIQTSFAMVYMPETAKWARPEPLAKAPKAVSGPAPAKVGGDPAAARALAAARKDGRILVAPGSTWKYLDNGVAPPAGWTAPGFDDEKWPEGAAQLGYGDHDEATVLKYGKDPKHKAMTACFRRTFTVADPKQFKTLVAGLLRDDGAVVYLNGVEAFRSNMPKGKITLATPAASVTAGDREKTFYPASVPVELLKPGRNVLAVEVHQAYPSSSDISFDLELYALPGLAKSAARGGATK